MKKTAFITGSSRGIGKAIALHLAKEEYRIILHGSKKSDALKNTNETLIKNGAETIVTCFDVSNKKAVDSASKAILKSVGTVDILVNNAGIISDRTLIKMSEHEWDSVIKTNLYGAFYVTQQILPKMKEQKFGRIINISSQIALKGNFGQTNYAASKAGLIGLTKSLAQEIAKYNITVNAVCPGIINTDILGKVPDDYIVHSLNQVAARRMGTPEEVASIVSYLASNDSSYITGAVIDVDGGWL